MKGGPPEGIAPSGGPVVQPISARLIGRLLR